VSCALIFLVRRVDETKFNDSNGNQGT